MQIDVLYFQGCPHYEPTLALVREVASELGIETGIRAIEVRSPDEAIARRFLGSPTVQVDGVDIEPARREDTDFTMSCRRYGDRGVPPRALLEAAFDAAIRS